MTEWTLLDKALGRAAGDVRDLIMAYKAWLPPERRAVLRELEETGMRLGVHVFPLPGGRWCATFTAVDARNQLQVFDTIEQASA